MDDITLIVSRLCTLLEDSIEENNWDLVQVVSKELNELYEDLERKSEYLGEY